MKKNCDSQILQESCIATSVSATICVGQYIKSYLGRQRMTILIAEKIKAICEESLKDWKMLRNCRGKKSFIYKWDPNYLLAYSLKLSQITIKATLYTYIYQQLF